MSRPDQMLIQICKRGYKHNGRTYRVVPSIVQRRYGVELQKGVPGWLGRFRWRFVEDCIMARSSRDEGSWTGWLCDHDSAKTIGKQIDPSGYLERYPRGKATNLNTLFKGFALYHHGDWFILDHRGSTMAKNLIKRSATTNGFWVTVEGVRKDMKIKVTQICEKTHPDRSSEYVVDKGEQNKAIRQDFKKMGI